MYEQLDGVSMDGSLGPMLANIIMTECEKVIVNKLIEDDIIKFYIRYVDDTLLVIKSADIPYVVNRFNSSDDNLKFTIATFENCVPHFLYRNLSKWIRYLSQAYPNWTICKF